MKENKIKVGVLTTFSNFNSSYSLTTVVKQQLKSLLNNGYSPTLFVLTNFNNNELKKVPLGVKVKPIVPQLILEPYTTGDLSNFEEDVSKSKEAFNEHLKDMDVILSHDIIFINSYIPYNEALRRAQEEELKNVKFLHWMHSGPSIRPTLDGSPYDNLYTLPKNSHLVYMNYTDAVRAAEHYGVTPQKVRTVFNPMDIRELNNFHPLSWELIDEYDLMSPEFICVYPLSTTRMGESGKQLDKVIKIMGFLKQRGNTVKLVVCNAHANATKEKQAIESMYSLGSRYGLERRDIVFTSLFDAPNNEQGVPHEVVRDMFTLSNLFIFPSVSENCPLVLLEAASASVISILNLSFPAMKDFLHERALYFRFGSLVDNPTYPNGEDNYYKDIATLIQAEYNNNNPIKAKTHLRQKFNMDYIFKKQLEPSILELYYGK